MEELNTQKKSKISQAVFSILIGSIMLYAIGKYGHLVNKKYVKTPCVIKYAKFIVYEKSYKLETEFDYVFAGREYTSNTFSQTAIANPEDVQLASRLERIAVKDQKYHCFVIENEPETAYLQEPATGLLFNWILPGFAYLLICFGSSYIFQTLGDRGVFGARKMGRLYTSAGLFIMGGILVYFLLPGILMAQGVKGWKKADAVIDHHIYSVEKEKEKKKYDVEILYRYKYEGQIYRSVSVNLLNSSPSDKESVLDLAKKYSVGKKIKCYVNPDEPEFAVLEKDVFMANLMGLVIVLVFISALTSLIYGGGRVDVK